MGNEANLRWAVDLMGFDSFNKYWLFINGYDPVTDFMDEFADYLWGYGSPALHDFIGQFKDDPDFICNVGIPADDVPNTETFISPFRLLPDSEHTPSWNEALYNHYDDNITVGGQTRYLFDAIIPHTYYHASGNWEDLLLDNIYPAYPENDGTFYSCTDPAADGWDFLNEDARLSLAYTKLLGSGVILPFGNYYEFIVTRHKEFYQVLSSYLHFNLTSAKKKDVWLTEWNIKTEPSAENPTLDEIQRLNVVDNAFPHSLVTQEWFLRNMKLNFVFPFREGFFTYATFHGFGGGSQTDPITPADCADCLQALPTPIDESLVNKYFMRRATYWNMLMLSEINRRQLKYLPSTFTKFVDNHNVTPTVFVDLDNEKLYVYFTNLKEGTQSYIINRNNLSTLFEGALDLELGYSWITALVFDRAYSTSGNNSIYRINDCYFCDDDPLTTNYLHPLEMQEINFDGANIPEVTAGLPYGAICVTVPSYSTGYFTIDLEISYRESEFNPLDNLVIYPNPASNEFRLFYSSGQQVEHESLNVTVYSLDGRKCITELSAENNALSIQNLPPGVYLVITQDNEQNKSTRKLVKID